jgi:hypothetical protein
MANPLLVQPANHSVFAQEGEARQNVLGPGPMGCWQIDHDDIGPWRHIIELRGAAHMLSAGISLSFKGVAHDS